MLRMLVVLVLVFSLASAPGAPVPTHLMPKKEPFSFPKTVGTQWVYSRPGEKDLTVAITSVEVKAEATVIEIQQSNGAAWETLRITSAGWFRTHLGRELVEPMCFLKLPLLPEESWTMGAELEGIVIARRMETVTVPAGTFKAIRIDAAYKFAGQNKTASFWYADGVGEVKLEDNGKPDRELKSFSLGKPAVSK